MQIRWRNIYAATAAFLLFGIVLVGCSGKEDFGKGKGKNRDGGDSKDGTTEVTPPDTLTAIKGDGVATLRGVVKLVGEEPNYAALTADLQEKINLKTDDRNTCLMGSEAEKTQYNWIVDKDKRVSNVFVWIRPADDKKEFFDVQTLVKEVKGWDKVKTIDQPHCAFEPHALVLFPRYVDPAAPKTKWSLAPDKGGPPATGQEFLVKNSGTLQHNTSTDGDPSRMMPVNQTVSPKGEPLNISNSIYPSYKKPVQVKCGIHPWMRSWVWAFEHPFASVSGGKMGEKKLAPGEFLIENIPAGVKLRVVALHESADFLNGGEKGEEITLKKGENTKDFTVKYK